MFFKHIKVVTRTVKSQARQLSKPGNKFIFKSFISELDFLTAELSLYALSTASAWFSCSKTSLYSICRRAKLFSLIASNWLTNLTTKALMSDYISPSWQANISLGQPGILVR